jgi:hypothetical protein
MDSMVSTTGGHTSSTEGKVCLFAASGSIWDYLRHDHELTIIFRRRLLARYLRIFRYKELTLMFAGCCCLGGRKGIDT